jgi:hypothetical protein
MLNTTNGQLVFRKSGEALHQDIRASLEGVARGMLKNLNLESINLRVVSTKTYTAAAFAKFAILHILPQENILDEAYVESVWKVYQSKIDSVTPDQFNAAMQSKPGCEYAYKRTYAHAVKRGLGLLLLALHCRGSITLPMRFEWPIGIDRTGILSPEQGIFSELLSFIRLLNPNNEKLAHQAFSSVGTSKKRKEWFLCCGTKLLLATGWLSPRDAKIEDLLEIKRYESQLGVDGDVLVFKALIDVLRERYGKTFSITVDDWSVEIACYFANEGVARRGILNAAREDETRKKLRRLGMEINLEGNDADLLSEIAKASPSLASTKALRARPRLPGLKAELENFAGVWLGLQESYTRVVKRESYKNLNVALSYLNIYLFFYLTYWFQRRPDSKLAYPNEPRKLISSIFISRLQIPKPTTDFPLTFVEYLELAAKGRRWEASTHYAVLKQVEVFFDFLELHGDELPGCTGFRQPIPDYVYPSTSRSLGTDKRPIPRRIFGIFLDYVEALRAHLEVILIRALCGEIDCVEVGRRMDNINPNVINTFATSSLVGFIPVIFTKEKTIPLQYIPNCLSLEWFSTIGGKRLKLPQPHALNQILVALHSGLRHNHIQWLDAGTFDSMVEAEDRDFTRLLVNTDKQLKNPWTPNVNFRVIEVLRDQLAWRNVISLPGFERRHYYNDNPSTKWPPILPLFAADTKGLPHNDSRYAAVWSDIVCAVNAILPSLGEGRIAHLSTLEPPGVAMNDPSARAKRLEYGSSCERVCELRVRTQITPHSTRVTVVSHFITLLPVEVIGKRITGQRPATVCHYTVIDPEDLMKAGVHQAMRLREQAYRGEHETWGNSGPGSKQYIRADAINSNLSKSMRENLQETLISYGCISITMNEGATSGLDVLRETRAANAAANTTEICPYGNHCPPEVVKQLRGVHRCGLCPYAVRSVDHLPAVSAKVKEFDEMLRDLTHKVQEALEQKASRFSTQELDRLDGERSRLAEELTGWQLNEEILDVARIRIAKGQDDRRWVVQKPEIILQDLQRVAVPNNTTEYLLLRLEECVAYPTSESPQIRARFDILRRNVLARTGQMRRAFDPAVPVNPAQECIGLLRTVVRANKLTFEDIVRMLEGDGHLEGLPSTPRLLLEGDAS